MDSYRLTYRTIISARRAVAVRTSGSRATTTTTAVATTVGTIPTAVCARAARTIVISHSDYGNEDILKNILEDILEGRVEVDGAAGKTCPWEIKTFNVVADGEREMNAFACTGD